MCFKKRFVIVLCLTYFFKKYIRKNPQIILLILGFIIVFILPLTANNYHGCWDKFSILLFLLKNENLFYYFLINIFIFSLGFYFLFTELKERNYYLSFISLYSIYFDVLLSFLYCNYIGIFEKLLKNIKLGKNISKFSSILLIFVIFAVLSWLLFYKEAKEWKIEYDKIEFNFIFLESILKSGVSFVTIISIFKMKLSGLYLLLSLYLEAYAAFIYPVIEMGKYLRGKELK